MEKIKRFGVLYRKAVEKIKNQSLRKAILFYMVISLIVSFLLSIIIIKTVQKIQDDIVVSYYDKEAVNYIEQESMRLGLDIEIRGIRDNQMTQTDVFMTEFLGDFVETWTVLIVPILGSAAAMFLFYHNKIRKPLQVLKDSSQLIARNQLDFTVDYENEDELGILCKQFEFMRKELVENNRRMWKMVEQEKALRSAVSHDIRSPLTVLKGYQEMLLEFIPEERIDREKVMEILEAGMEQIDRLHEFVEIMRRLSSLEERKIQYMDTDVKILYRKMKDTASVMAQAAEKSCEVDEITENRKISADCFLVMEVAENLLSNALRFAKERVTVRLRVEDSLLELCVRDDGQGFEEDTETLTKAYYHSNTQDDHIHFGLGLYLCRVYCEKHGGYLVFANHREGGGEVRAGFRVKIAHDEKQKSAK